MPSVRDAKKKKKSLMEKMKDQFKESLFGKAQDETTNRDKKLRDKLRKAMGK